MICCCCCVLVVQLHNIRKFVAHNTRLRPAYFIAVDHSQQTIIWGECMWDNKGEGQGPEELYGLLWCMMRAAALADRTASSSTAAEARQQHTCMLRLCSTSTRASSYHQNTYSGLSHTSGVSLSLSPLLLSLCSLQPFVEQRTFLM